MSHRGLADSPMSQINHWSERTIAIALAIAIALIGIGPMSLGAGPFSISAWSVARTTLFFWLGSKICLAISERRWPFEPGGWARQTPLLVFFLVSTVSLLPDFSAAGDYRYFAFACFHAVIVTEAVRDRQRLRWALLLLGVMPAVLVLRGIIHAPAVLSFDLARRFGMPLDHPNTAGFVLAVTVPLNLWCIAAVHGWRRGLALLCCLLQLLALLLTYSRGAWIGALGATFLYLSLARQWKVALIILTIGVASVAMTPTVRARLVSLSQPMTDASMGERLMLARQAVSIGADHPLLGVGYGRGRVKAALRERLRDTPFESLGLTHTHNIYVELFAGTGLLGLGSYLWLIGLAIYQSWHVARDRPVDDSRIGFALTSAWLAVVLCGLGDVPFFHHETRILLFTLLGLTASAYGLTRQASRVTA